MGGPFGEGKSHRDEGAHDVAVDPEEHHDALYEHVDPGLQDVDGLFGEGQALRAGGAVERAEGVRGPAGRRSDAAALWVRVCPLCAQCGSKLVEIITKSVKVCTVVSSRSA